MTLLKTTLCLYKLSSLINLVDVTEMLTYSISKIEYIHALQQLPLFMERYSFSTATGR